MVVLSITRQLFTRRVLPSVCLFQASAVSTTSLRACWPTYSSIHRFRPSPANCRCSFRPPHTTATSCLLDTSSKAVAAGSCRTACSPSTSLSRCSATSRACSTTNQVAARSICTRRRRAIGRPVTSPRRVLPSSYRCTSTLLRNSTMSLESTSSRRTLRRSCSRARSNRSFSLQTSSATSASRAPPSTSSPAARATRHCSGSAASTCW